MLPICTIKNMILCDNSFLSLLVICPRCKFVNEIYINKKVSSYETFGFNLIFKNLGISKCVNRNCQCKFKIYDEPE